MLTSSGALYKKETVMMILNIYFSELIFAINNKMCIIFYNLSFIEHGARHVFDRSMMAAQLRVLDEYGLFVARIRKRMYSGILVYRKSTPFPTRIPLFSNRES